MATASAPRLRAITLRDRSSASSSLLDTSGSRRVALTGDLALDDRPPPTEGELRAWAETTIAARAAGTELPFRDDRPGLGRPIGSSRYMNIALDHRRIEIGWTWVGTRSSGPAQPRGKLLMLRHASTRWVPASRVQDRCAQRKSRTAL